MFRRSAIMMDTWRSQGITYVQSLTITSAALQKCATEAKQAKYGKHSAALYYAQVMDGQGGFEKLEKVPKDVTEIAAMAQPPQAAK